MGTSAGDKAVVVENYRLTTRLAVQARVFSAHSTLGLEQLRDASCRHYLAPEPCV